MLYEMATNLPNPYEKFHKMTHFQFFANLKNSDVPAFPKEHMRSESMQHFLSCWYFGLYVA